MHETLSMVIEKTGASIHNAVLYSRRLACGRGEIGRRARLRIWCREAWGFESLRPHRKTSGTMCRIFFYPLEAAHLWYQQLSPYIARVMKRIALTLCLLLALPLGVIRAQTNAGGRPTAMAGSYVAMADGWSAFHNQAGLTHIEGITVGAFYENRFGLNALSDKGFLAAIPFKGKSFALSYHGFGDANYSSAKTGLAYAMKLGEKLDAGIQLDYFSVRLGENYGSRQGFMAEGGFQYHLNALLTLAAHVSNPNRAKLSDYIDERMPGTMRAGALLRLSDKVLLSGEVYKITGSDASVRAGVEYRVVENAAIRAGFGSVPGTYTFGFGWKVKTFLIDMAAAYHPILGFNPHVSLTYSGSSKP